jgi:hypothetical protein
MTKKRAAKTTTARGIRSLPAKTPTAGEARDVAGGKATPKLAEACSKGTHYKEVVIE